MQQKIIFRQECYDILSHSIEYSDAPMEATAAHDFYIKFSTKKGGIFISNITQSYPYPGSYQLSASIIPLKSHIKERRNTLLIFSMDSRHVLTARNNKFFTKKLFCIFYKTAIVSFLTMKKMNML